MKFTEKSWPLKGEFHDNKEGIYNIIKPIQFISSVL